MRHVFLIALIVASGATAVAQDRAVGSETEASSRATLLKKAVAQDRGDITAMEPSASDEGGVIVGYSSGVVLHCYRDQTCREFDGTPGVPVEHIAVSRTGGLAVSWVAYRHGVLYRCADYECRQFQ